MSLPTLRMAGLALALAGGAGLAAGDARAAIQIQRAGRGWEITVDQGTPLPEALEALGELGNFPVEVVGDPVTLEAQRFGARNLAAAVRRLGRGQIMVIWHGAPDAAGSTVRRVRVLARERSDEPPQPPPQGEPAIDSDAGPTGLDLEALAEKSVDERIAAISDLAGAEDRAATVPDLEQLAETDPAPEVRSTAVRLLAGADTDDAWSAVEHSLHDDDAMVRSAALVELANREQDFPVAAVEAVAQNDPEPEVRRLARTVLRSRDEQ
ncbi:MAG: HEAT repeat domain-containing protein [Geminicoccaceae bacterium]